VTYLRIPYLSFYLLRQAPASPRRNRRIYIHICNPAPSRHPPVPTIDHLPPPTRKPANSHRYNAVLPSPSPSRLSLWPRAISLLLHPPTPARAHGRSLGRFPICLVSKTLKIRTRRAQRADSQLELYGESAKQNPGLFRVCTKASTPPQTPT
jgi:hypothetical protein